MSDIHADLKYIGPIDWSDVPLDDLPSFARRILTAGEALCDSIPPPPDGDDFETSKPIAPQPNAARRADDLVNSSARPQVPDEHVQKQRKSWGKPIKITPEENSMGLTMYKMAGKDRHGAWFARHSILEGLSYARFRKALQEEFATSMAVQEGPGSGAVRGLGADRQVEYHEIEGVGRLEVYQNSAQFPGPTSPREFVPLVVTAESTKSAGLPKDRAPAKQYLIVSKPVTHPDVPERSDWIRGGYESVEMIREIPLDVPADARPVQWIQLSRSDPGGSIPRFMVERGTPSAVCADAEKFLGWACSIDAPAGDTGEAVPSTASAVPKESQAVLPPYSASPMTRAKPAETRSQSHTSPRTSAKGKSSAQPDNTGIAFHLTNALGAGLDQYVPAVVADYAKTYIQGGTRQYDGYDSDTSSTSASSRSSHTSFESADENLNPAAASTSSLSTSQSRGTIHDGEILDNKHGREVQRLSREEQKAHDKLEKKAQRLAKKSIDRKEHDKDDARKIQEKHDKELRKARKKHDKEIGKLQAKRDREVRRARQKRDKEQDADVLDRLVHERDTFRDLCQKLSQENEALKRELRAIREGADGDGGVDGLVSGVKT